MSDGWVRIYHPDQCDSPPNPDDPEDAIKFGVVTKESFNLVWERRGFVDLDAVREDATGLPEKATDRVAWIDEPEDVPTRLVRARAVLDDEVARGTDARTTVLDHAYAVINEDTSEEDETASDDIVSEE